MSNYNSKLCDILTEMNNYITIPSITETNTNNPTSTLNSDDITNAISNVEKCNNNPKFNIVINYIKNLMNNPTTSKNVVELGNKGLNIVENQSQLPELSDIYKKIIDLDNEIQNETKSYYNKYLNQPDSLISEQNKQYENIKFNKIYLFLFNLGIIFLILRYSFVKKTN